MSENLIIGAGPAGLTAAYELAKLGYRSTLIEADQQVGGLSRTVNYHGYRFDIGGHRFFTKVPYIQTLWDEILGEDLLVRSRLSRIHYREKFFDYPFKVSNAVVNLGLFESAMVALSYAKSYCWPYVEEDNFEQWVSNRFGSRLYEIFFKTYTEKVWGIPCREISSDWAAQRIKNLSFREALRNAIFGDGKSRSGQVITSLIDRFQYPRLGPGMMWERCEELLAGNGTKTLRGFRAMKVRHRRGRVESVVAHSRDDTLEIAVDNVLTTMPLRSLIAAFDPAPPENVLLAASRLRYRDYLTVVLIIKRESVFEDNWIYIHSPDVKMGRIQNYKNWSPEMVPDASRTSLGLEYFLWDQDDEWHWSDDRLINFGIQECAQLGLIEPREVEEGTVIRMRKAYPVYDRNYHDCVATLKQYLENIENLQTIGRNGLHRYNNQDHSMLTGVYAARNLDGANHDVWDVNTESHYHEESFAAQPSRGDRLVPTRIPEPFEEGTEDVVDESVREAFEPLDTLAFGLAAGIVSGIGLFTATAVLLFQGGSVVGPTLGLLGNYLPAYEVTWPGAVVGLFEGGIAGTLVGSLFAVLRNWSIGAYMAWIVRRAAVKQRKDLLDKV